MIITHYIFSHWLFSSFSLHFDYFIDWFHSFHISVEFSRHFHFSLLFSLFSLTLHFIASGQSFSDASSFLTFIIFLFDSFLRHWFSPITQLLLHWLAFSHIWIERIEIASSSALTDCFRLHCRDYIDSLQRLSWHLADRLASHAGHNSHTEPASQPADAHSIASQLSYIEH
jgi:hypothetical protein